MRHRTEDGAVAVEYVLLAFLIAVGVIGAVFALGQAAASSYLDSCTQVSAASPAGADCTD